MNKYVKGTILTKEYELNVNRLTDIVSDLKWTYFETYHMEPKFIKIPIWVHILLRQYARQLIGYYIIEEKTILTYMGLQICETSSIDKIEDIEVF